jgi:hypothetical protein
VSFAALKGYVMDSIGDESIGVREHGSEKSGAEGLIASSVDFGWAGLSAELRAHDRGLIIEDLGKYKEMIALIQLDHAMPPTATK